MQGDKVSLKRKPISNGEYGYIFRTTDRYGQENHQKVAKTFNCEENVTIAEFYCLLALSHPNIVRATDVARYTGAEDIPKLCMNVCILMPKYVCSLYDAGMLAKFLPQMIKQCYSGLQYLHSEGILHLDIKPENIFIDAYHNAHIADFGMALLLPPNTWQVFSTRKRIGDAYISPEIQLVYNPGLPVVSFGSAFEWNPDLKITDTRGFIYTSACDFWALGKVIDMMRRPSKLLCDHVELDSMYNHLCNDAPHKRKLRADEPDVVENTLLDTPNEPNGVIMADKIGRRMIHLDTLSLESENMYVELISVREMRKLGDFYMRLLSDNFDFPVTVFLLHLDMIYRLCIETGIYDLSILQDTKFITSTGFIACNAVTSYPILPTLFGTFDIDALQGNVIRELKGHVLRKNNIYGELTGLEEVRGLMKRVLSGRRCPIHKSHPLHLYHLPMRYLISF